LVLVLVLAFFNINHSSLDHTLYPMHGRPRLAKLSCVME
jgi:hypothetical protein